MTSPTRYGSPCEYKTPYDCATDVGCYWDTRTNLCRETDTPYIYNQKELMYMALTLHADNYRPLITFLRAQPNFTPELLPSLIYKGIIMGIFTEVITELGLEETDDERVLKHIASSITPDNYDELIGYLARQHLTPDVLLQLLVTLLDENISVILALQQLGMDLGDLPKPLLEHLFEQAVGSEQWELADRITQYDFLRKNYPPIYRIHSSNERDSIEWYTSYGSVALRDMLYKAYQMTPYDWKQLQYLRSAFKKAIPTKQPLRVYRGISEEWINFDTMELLYKYGDIISTTTNIQVSNDFTKGKSCCIIQITILPGSRILYVEPYTSVQHEKEVMLDLSQGDLVVDEIRTISLEGVSLEDYHYLPQKKGMRPTSPRDKVLIKATYHPNWGYWS